MKIISDEAFVLGCSSALKDGKIYTVYTRRGGLVKLFMANTSNLAPVLANMVPLIQKFHLDYSKGRVFFFPDHIKMSAPAKTVYDIHEMQVWGRVISNLLKEDQYVEGLWAEFEKTDFSDINSSNLSMLKLLETLGYINCMDFTEKFSGSTPVESQSRIAEVCSSILGSDRDLKYFMMDTQIPQSVIN